METLAAYIPTDRHQALAQGLALPQRGHGAVLFADISGFTPLTDAFVKTFDSRRGAEEFPKQLNLIYETLIVEVHRYQGSVVNFSGDGLTCWFDQDQGLRAVVCALQMQQVMKQFKKIFVASGLTVSLALKAAITTGPVRRFQIGDPDVQYLDVLAGATVDRVALAEKHAEPGEVIVGPEVVAQLRDQLEINEWRGKADIKFAAVGGLRNSTDILPLIGSTDNPLDQKFKLTETQIRPWLLTPIYEQKDYDQDQFFLAQIRPAVALFLRFSGIDYDQDESADAKLDAYIRWVQSLVTRYGGYLIQLTHGDKGSYLYAAFGAPVAHDNDSVRAVAAALDLRLPPPRIEFY
jgi:class 3 adenylate cyclase